MTQQRYLVADVPTVGPHKGKITKVWDFDLQFTDAHQLRKRIANKRLSKWPVVIDGAHAKLPEGELATPTPAELDDLKIDARKFSGGTPDPGSGPGWSDAELAEISANAAKKATEEANQRARAVAALEVTPEQLASDNFTRAPEPEGVVVTEPHTPVDLAIDAHTRDSSIMADAVAPVDHAFDTSTDS